MANKNNVKTAVEVTRKSPDDLATRGELIVATALSSIDFSAYSSIAELEKAALKRISTLTRSFFNPYSTAMRMLDAVKIKAVIKNIEYEESSTRFIITFVSDNNEDGSVETIRSDRTDRFNGDQVRAMWNDKLIGKHVIIYKTMEETGNRLKPSCRIAPYVDVLD